MNILILNCDSEPRFMGGIKRVIITLAKEWKQSGHQVFFLSQCMTDYRPNEVEGIQQFFFPLPQDMGRKDNEHIFISLIEKRKINIVLNPYIGEDGLSVFAYHQKRFLANVKFVSAYHFSPTHDIDVIQHSFFPRYFSGNIMKKWLIDVAILIKFAMKGKKDALVRIKKRFEDAVGYSDALVLLSERYAEVVSEIIGSSQRLCAINNPAEIMYSLDEIDFSKKEKIVVWCGRVGYGAKRVDRMLGIWKRVEQVFPEWQCYILGSGDIDRFSNLAKMNHIENIHFVGNCNPNDWYERASISCMTSSVEGWPMVLLEAMSFGCVPVAYNSFAAADEIISNGKNGYLVTPFNEAKYVEALVSLMRDEEKRQNMATFAYQSIEKYSVKRIAKQWISLFNSLLFENGK